MSGFAKQMQIYPEMSRDFISKGLKRFLFCLILILHINIFVLPTVIYVFNEWLKPDEKVIAVTLVDFPTTDPNPGGGGPAETAQGDNTQSTPTDQSPPALPDVKPLDNSIPDIPDIPDVPDIKIPVPPKKVTPVKPKKVTPVKPKVEKKTVQKTKPSQPKKQKLDMVKQIQQWRKKHGRVTPSKGTGKQSNGNNAAAQRNQALKKLANELRGAGGGSGSTGTGSGREKASGAGTGGIYDPTLSDIFRLIDRYWVEPQISSGSSPETVLITFDIDGHGGIYVRHVETTRDHAIDSSVSALLKRLQKMRITPPDGRRTKTYTIRLNIREE